MTLNKAMVEEAALGWFEELGYAVLPGPPQAPGEPAARGLRQNNPTSSKAPQATCAQPATVQSICRMNR